MTIDLTDRYAIALQRIIEGIDTEEDRGLAPFHAKKMQERVAAVRTAHLQELRGETEEETLEKAVEAVYISRADLTGAAYVRLAAPTLTAPLRAKLQAQEARIKEYREAANWVLHVVSGVGKDGNPPSSAEETAAFDALKKCLEAS